jgi:hypothetical protein
MEDCSSLGFLIYRLLFDPRASQAPTKSISTMLNVAKGSSKQYLILPKVASAVGLTLILLSLFQDLKTKECGKFLCLIIEL